MAVMIRNPKLKEEFRASKAEVVAALRKAEADQVKQSRYALYHVAEADATHPDIYVDSKCAECVALEAIGYRYEPWKYKSVPTLILMKSLLPLGVDGFVPGDGLGYDDIPPVTWGDIKKFPEIYEKVRKLREEHTGFRIETMGDDFQFSMHTLNDRLELSFGEIADLIEASW